MPFRRALRPADRHTLRAGIEICATAGRGLHDDDRSVDIADVANRLVDQRRPHRAHRHRLAKNEPRQVKVVDHHVAKQPPGAHIGDRGGPGRAVIETTSKRRRTAATRFRSAEKLGSKRRLKPTMSVAPDRLTTLGQARTRSTQSAFAEDRLQARGRSMRSACIGRRADGDRVNVRRRGRVDDLAARRLCQGGLTAVRVSERHLAVGR
jgi:hypothetical protein